MAGKLQQIAAAVNESAGTRWFTITTENMHVSMGSCYLPGSGISHDDLSIYVKDHAELRPIFDALLPLARELGWLDAERPEVEGFETVQRAETGGITNV